MREEIIGLLVSNEERLLKLEEILVANDIKYKLNSDGSTRNVIVELLSDNVTDKDSIIVLSAHYDIFPNSTGINDNTCSLVLLINFIKLAKAHGVKQNIEIVFTDKEEAGMLGSDLYLRTNNVKKIKYAIIFDIIGFGDLLIYGTHTKEQFEWLSKVGIQKVSTVLPSDNLIFERYHVPVALITATHLKDLHKSPTKNDSYYIGLDAEFYMSFHGRKKDNDICIINLNLIDYLLSVLSGTFLSI